MSEHQMNGAEALILSLEKIGIEVAFGTGRLGDSPVRCDATR